MNYQNKFIKNSNLNLEKKIFLIDKPKFFTSNQVIQIIKKTYCLRKIGYAGTLDPAATGLMIIATGTMTKNLNQLSFENKEYLAEIKFNFQTSTYDAEGKIVKYKKEKIKLFSLKNLLANFNHVFLYQKPPIYSAIKINGKKLYEYARKNKAVELPYRKTFINATKLIYFDFENQIVTVNLNVSKGFYVRSFANDLGIYLNNYAYLYNLKRTKIGKFNLEDALHFFDLVKQI